MFSVNDSTQELCAAGLDTAILDVDATEQCGPHLALNLDTFVTQYYARA